MSPWPTLEATDEVDEPQTQTPPPAKPLTLDLSGLDDAPQLDLSGLADAPALDTTGLAKPPTKTPALVLQKAPTLDLTGLAPAVAPTASTPPASEAAFQTWYAGQAKAHGLNPNPDDPQQFYDYRAAYRAGATPDATGHWPSQFKTAGHPNMVVGGFNVQTGARVPGTPQASEAELVKLGWAPEDAKRLTQENPQTAARRQMQPWEHFAAPPPPVTQQRDPHEGDTLSANPAAMEKGLLTGDWAADLITTSRDKTGDGTTRLSDKAVSKIPFIGPVADTARAIALIRAAQRVQAAHEFAGQDLTPRQAPSADAAADDPGSGRPFQAVFDAQHEARRALAAAATPADEQLLSDYQDQLYQAQAHPTSRAYQAADVVTDSIGFAAEIAATSGLFTGTKALLRKALTEALGTIAEKKAAQLAVRGIAAAAGAAAGVAALPVRVAKNTSERMEPSAQQIDEHLKGWDPKFLPEVAKAFGDEFIQYFTEFTGHLPSELGAHLATTEAAKQAERILAQMPIAQRVTALKTLVMEQWQKVHPGQKVADFFNEVASRSGWHGTLGEYFEERVGDLMNAQPYLRRPGESGPAMVRMVTGEQTDPAHPVDNPRLQAIQDFWDQTIVELAAFAVPGLARHALNTAVAAVRTPTPATPGETRTAREAQRGTIVARQRAREATEGMSQAVEPPPDVLGDQPIRPGEPPQPPGAPAAGVLAHPVITQLRALGYDDAFIQKLTPAQADFLATQPGVTPVSETPPPEAPPATPPAVAQPTPEVTAQIDEVPPPNTVVPPSTEPGNVSQVPRAGLGEHTTSPPPTPEASGWTTARPTDASKMGGLGAILPPTTRGHEPGTMGSVPTARGWVGVYEAPDGRKYYAPTPRQHSEQSSADVARLAEQMRWPVLSNLGKPLAPYSDEWSARVREFIQNGRPAEELPLEELQQRAERAHGPWRVAARQELARRQAAPVAPPGVSVPITPRVVPPRAVAPLPRDLAGAKPRYNLGKKSYQPLFASQVDLAGYILAQATPSPRDADYLAYVQAQTGMTAEQARAFGRRVKQALYPLATAQGTPGVLLVPQIWDGQQQQQAPPLTTTAVQQQHADLTERGEAFTAENLQRIFRLTAPQAKAAVAIAEAMGLPLAKIRLVSGGKAGEHALPHTQGAWASPSMTGRPATATVNHRGDLVVTLPSKAGAQLLHRLRVAGFREVTPGRTWEAEDTPASRAALEGIATITPADVYYQHAQAESRWYYSNISKALDTWQNKGTSQQLLAHLGKFKGAMDEAEATGLTAWLKDKPSVARDDVRQYLATHQIDVQEVEKGARPPLQSLLRRPQIASNVRELMNLGYRVDLTEEAALHWVGVGPYPRGPLPAEAQQFWQPIWEAVQELENQGASTKHGGGGLQIPGGTNYRELLLTLPLGPPTVRPPKVNPPTVTMEEFARIDPVAAHSFAGQVGDYAGRRVTPDELQVELNNVLYRAANHLDEWVPEEWVDRVTAAAIVRAFPTVPRGWERVEEDRERVEADRGFRSSHWDEPNVLAHIRLNDRVVNGQRVLFLEEVQSDWGQRGRREGYASDIAKERAALNAEWKTLNDQEAIRGIELSPEQAARFTEIVKRLNAIKLTRPVPDMPFKGHAWKELAIKRVLAYAAERGYDGIAWTTGLQQVDRYTNELRQRVDRITWTTSAKGLRNISAWKGNRTVFAGMTEGEKFVAGPAADKTVEEVLGKAMAERVAADETGDLTGDDLTIGGKGMIGFYDRELPNLTNAIVKKFGGKVGRVELSSPGRERDQVDWTLGILGVPAKPVPAAATGVHYLATPQAMRDQIRDQGLPLFQGPKGFIDFAEFAEAGRIYIHALEGADISTVVHELMHAFERLYLAEGLSPDERGGITDAELAEFKAWAGATTTDDGQTHMPRAAKEKAAKGFERYVMTGTAPTPGLKSLFAKLAAWLAKVYGKLSKYFDGIEITPAAKAVFDKIVMRAEYLRARAETGTTVGDARGQEDTGVGSGPGVSRPDSQRGEAPPRGPVDRTGVRGSPEARGVAQVPAAARPRFDALLADARTQGYQGTDDSLADEFLLAYNVAVAGATEAARADEDDGGWRDLLKAVAAAGGIGVGVEHGMRGEVQDLLEWLHQGRTVRRQYKGGPHKGEWYTVKVPMTSAGVPGIPGVFKGTGNGGKELDVILSSVQEDPQFVNRFDSLSDFIEALRAAVRRANDGEAAPVVTQEAIDGFLAGGLGVKEGTRWWDTTPPADDEGDTSFDPASFDDARKYASTQIDLPGELAQRVLNLSAEIPLDALTEKGREQFPHVTVQYGLHSDDPAAVQQALAGHQAADLVIGDVGVFPASETGDADVLYLSLEGSRDALTPWRDAVAASGDVTETHDTYTPHITLAYVEPGRGEAIARTLNETNGLRGHVFQAATVTFSPSQGDPTTIKLDAPATPTREAPSEITHPADLLAHVREELGFKKSDTPQIYRELRTHTHQIVGHVPTRGEMRAVVLAWIDRMRTLQVTKEPGSRAETGQMIRQALAAMGADPDRPLTARQQQHADLLAELKAKQRAAKAAKAPVLYFRSGASMPADFEGLADANVPIGVVAGKLSPEMLTRAVRHVVFGGKLFVDSGAFTAFRAGLTNPDARPVNFDEVMHTYRALVARVAEAGEPTGGPSGLYLVAPDVVGDAQQTRELQTRYQRQIGTLLEQGARVVVPIQKSADLRLVDQMQWVLGNIAPGALGKNVVLGIPFNKAAFTADEVAAALKDLNAPHVAIHLLGIGEQNRQYETALKTIRDARPDVEISSDSNRLSAMFVSGRPAQESVKKKIEARAPNRVDDDANADTTELAGEFYRGNLSPGDAFSREELRQLADTLGVTPVALQKTTGDARQALVDQAGGDQVIDLALHQIALARAKKTEGPKARRETITEHAGGDKPVVTDRAQQRAEMAARLKAKQERLTQADTPFDPDDAAIMGDMVGLYVEDGLDFPAAVRAFQQEYGTGARTQDALFEHAWRERTEEVRHVAAVLDAPKPPPKPAEDSVAKQLTTLLAQFKIVATPLQDGGLALRGKTYDHREAIRDIVGGRNWNTAAAPQAWTVPPASLASVLDLFRRRLAARDGPGASGSAHIRDPRIAGLRRAAEGRPDRGEFVEAIGDFVHGPTVALLEGGLTFGMPQVVIDEQVEDVARIIRAYRRQSPLFLLASEPGSGKTFVLGGAIREFPAGTRVIYVTLRTELISQIRADLRAYGINDVTFVTYPGMREAPIQSSDVLIFDEAHSIKNVSGAAVAKQAAKWIARTRMTVFATATPFENPTEAAYLAPTGIFKEVFNNSANDFALAFGARSLNLASGRPIVIWQRSATSDADAKAARAWLVREGVYTSRRTRLPKNQVDARLVKFHVSPQDERRYRLLAEAAAAHDGELAGFGAPWVINFQKRLLEAAKVDQGIVEAKAALARGRFPILFVETKAERVVDIPDLIERLKAWQQAADQAAAMGERPPSRTSFGAAQPGVTEVLADYMARSGEAIIEIPSAEDVIEAAFPDQVAVFTGSVSPVKAQRNLDAWRAGTKPVLVATMAKGGTGLSLHDKVGDHQTTQININLPWTATQVVQVAQRSARYGLKGRAEMQWIFAENVPFDRRLARKVGGRMADMGAVVHGERLARSEEIEDWNFEDLLFSEAAQPEPEPEVPTRPSQGTSRTVEPDQDALAAKNRAEQEARDARIAEKQAAAKEDTLDTGEKQPRLPGDVGDVRDQEVKQPELGEVKFNLEGEGKAAAEQRPAQQETLFGTPPAKPAKAKTRAVDPNQDTLFQSAPTGDFEADLATLRGDDDVLYQDADDQPRVMTRAEIEQLAEFTKTDVADLLVEARERGYTITDDAQGEGGTTLQMQIIPGGKEFLEQDVIPKAVEAARQFNAARSDIKALFSPTTVSTPARDGSHIMRAEFAALEQKNERARRLTKQIAKAFDWELRRARTPEAKAEVLLAFVDAVESGNIGDLSPEKAKAALLLRSLLDRRLKEVQQLGRLKEYIEHYFPHEWVEPGKAVQAIRRLFGKRPLQGPKSFLKQRTIPTTRAGIEAGLIPISYNPVELVLRKLLEMDKFIMATRIIRGEARQGLAAYVPVGQKEPEDFIRFNHSFATVYGKPVITIKEAYDPALMDGMHDWLVDMGVNVSRLPRIGGRRWGYAMGDQKVVTKFAGYVGILMHEAGHILDARYGLKDLMVKDKAYKQELRDLADLRDEGEVETRSESRTRYVRKGEEKIANLVHAYLYMPERAKQIAPMSYRAMERLINAHAELAPLKALQRGQSLRIDVGTAEVPIGGALIKGYYYGHPDVVRLLDNHLAPGLRGSVLFNLYRRIGNVLNQVQLGLSAFHLTMTGLESVISKQSLALELLARGQVGEALRAQLEVPISPLIDLVRGHRALKEFYARDASTDQLDGLIDTVVQAGGGFGWNMFEHDGAPARFMQAFRQGNYLGMAFRAIPALIELQAKPIMEGWVPRLKMAAFLDLARMELKTLGPDPNLIEVRRVLADAWDSIDNRFGQLRYDNLLWHSALKDLGMASFRALGWNIGSVREAFGMPMAQLRQMGIVPGAGHGGGHGWFERPVRMKNTGQREDGTPIYEAMKEPLLHRKLSWFISTIFIYGLMGALYQYLHTGKWPETLKDYFFPFNGRYRVSIPGYVKDWYAFFVDPVQTVGHKLNPNVTWIADLLENEDYYGTELRNPDDPLVDQAKQLLEMVPDQFTPISVKSFKQGNRSLEDAAENFFGINKAPASITRSAAEEMIRGFRTPQPRSRQQAEQAALARQIREGTTAKTPEGAASVAAAKATGELSKRQVQAAIKSAKRDSLQAGVLHLTLAHALQVYEVATPEERADLKKILNAKIDKISDAPKAQREWLRKRAAKIMALPVAPVLH